MRRIALVAFLALSAPVSNGVAGADGARVPVVVELFSSEGCSSCPPADALLARLDREQPIAGVEVVALEMHVDYWNYLGWSDPFSQAQFSARQRERARAFGTNRVYTPQLVVDGRDELVGSNAPGARLAIEGAARAPHVAVKLARVGDDVSIEIASAPASEGACRAMLATTERGLRTRVTAGENSGATLEHGPVVRALRAIGDLGPSGLVTRVRAPAKPNTRVVVFVEGRDTMRVLGAATTL